MQFEAKYAASIAAGTQTLTFRRWKRPQAIAGNTYRTAAGRLVVETVSVVHAASITDSEAVRAGYASAAVLVASGVYAVRHRGPSAKRGAQAPAPVPAASPEAGKPATRIRSSSLQPAHSIVPSRLEKGASDADR